MTDALNVVAALRLEDGRLWGQAAEPWQIDDARAVLDPDGTPYHWLGRPRGASKTSDAAALCLAVLMTQAPPGARLYAVATDADQAALLIDSARGFVQRDQALAGELAIETRRIISQSSEASLTVLAADAASAWGLRPYLVIVDELAMWGSTTNARGVFSAVVSALPKILGARLVVLTSAGDPAHWSRSVLDKAKASTRWRVSEIPGPTPWISLEALQEQRSLLTESQYVRLHLNRWTAAEDRLVRPDDLAACIVLDGPLDPIAGLTYRIGADLGLRHDRTAIAVCHAEPTEDRSARRVILDRLHVLEAQGKREVQLADVEGAIFEAAGSYGGARVRLDPWQAIGLKQRLEARGVRVEEFSFSSKSVGRLASTLHLLLRDRLLSLPDDVELIDELANVRLRETTPGVLRMDHDPDKHDDRAIALALAATALVEEGPVRPLRATSAVGQSWREGLPSVAGRRVAAR